uniref:C-type lectin domain-containing protein n=1 Tax=Gopherus evgoodei TaxID=1825980 RepID=A0A8C4YAH9_9SAUR
MGASFEFPASGAKMLWASSVSFQGHKCSLCPENWFWYGKVCYHLSIEWKRWQGSKDYCSSHDSRLLKIESKEELVMKTYPVFRYPQVEGL